MSALTLSTVAASLIVSVARPSFTGCIGSRIYPFSSFGNCGRVSYGCSAPKDVRWPDSPKRLAPRPAANPRVDERTRKRPGAALAELRLNLVICMGKGASLARFARAPHPASPSAATRSGPDHAEACRDEGRGKPQARSAGG